MRNTRTTDDTDNAAATAPARPDAQAAPPASQPLPSGATGAAATGDAVETAVETAKEPGEKLLWAFAIDATRPVRDKPSRAKRATIPKYKLHRYYVTVCSPKLKSLGVRAGMRYDEAKRLVPAMRIFVYNR